MYGKFIDGKIIISDKFYTTDKEQVFNPTDEMLRENGFLPIINIGTEDSSVYNTPVYTLKEDHIELTWVKPVSDF